VLLSTYLVYVYISMYIYVDGILVRVHIEELKWSKIIYYLCEYIIIFLILFSRVVTFAFDADSQKNSNTLNYIFCSLSRSTHRYAYGAVFI